MTQDIPAWGSPDSQREEPVRRPSQPSDQVPCPVCAGTAFQEEEGRMQTRWGMGSHIFTIRICTNCQHSLFFYQSGGMAF